MRAPAQGRLRRQSIDCHSAHFDSEGGTRAQLWLVRGRLESASALALLGLNVSVSSARSTSSCQPALRQYWATSTALCEGAGRAQNPARDGLVGSLRGGHQQRIRQAAGDAANQASIARRQDSARQTHKHHGPANGQHRRRSARTTFLHPPCIQRNVHAWRKRLADVHDPALVAGWSAHGSQVMSRTCHRRRSCPAWPGTMSKQPTRMAGRPSASCPAYPLPIQLTTYRRRMQFPASSSRGLIASTMTC